MSDNNNENFFLHILVPNRMVLDEWFMKKQYQIDFRRSEVIDNIFSSYAIDHEFLNNMSISDLNYLSQLLKEIQIEDSSFIKKLGRSKYSDIPDLVNEYLGYKISQLHQEK